MSAPSQSLPSQEVPASIIEFWGHPKLSMSSFQAGTARSSPMTSTLTCPDDQSLEPEQAEATGPGSNGHPRQTLESLCGIYFYDPEADTLVPFVQQTDAVGKPTQKNKLHSNEGAELKLEANNGAMGLGETISSDRSAIRCLPKIPSPRRILRRRKARIFVPLREETDTVCEPGVLNTPHSDEEREAQGIPRSSPGIASSDIKLIEGRLNIDRQPRTLRRRAARIFKPLHKQTEKLGELEHTKPPHSNQERHNATCACENKNSDKEVIDRPMSPASHPRCVRRKKAQIFLPLGKNADGVGKLKRPKQAQLNEGAELKGQRREMSLRRITKSEKILIKNLSNMEIADRRVPRRAST